MIEFVSEFIREAFHKTSAEKQTEIMNLAVSLLNEGSVITITCVELYGIDEKESEIAFRIDKKFNPSASR